MGHLKHHNCWCQGHILSGDTLPSSNPMSLVLLPLAVGWMWVNIGEISRTASRRSSSWLDPNSVNLLTSRRWMGKHCKKSLNWKKKQQNPPSTLGSNTTSRTYYSLSWFYFSWIFKIYYLLSEYCWYLQFPMRKIKCVISAVHLLEIPCLAKKGMLCLHFDTSAKKYTNHKL